MLLKNAIQLRTRLCQTAILAGKVAIALAVPVLVYAFGINPPLPYTGAPGQGTCASCHGTLTVGSGVTVNAPSSYNPGGAPVSMTVNIAPLSGGFELTVLTQSTNAQAGTLTAAPPQNAVSTVGAIQYVYSTVELASWTFSWTPPATNVGNVVLYVTGGTHGTNYSNSYLITAPSITPPPGTLSVSPTSLTFTVNGAAPPTQSIQVTSGGSPIAFTTSVSTTSGGNWLTVLPPGANTPASATVSVVATGLATGTYHGTVAFTSAGASNSPLAVPVSLDITAPIPQSLPTLNLSSAGLNFSAPAGGIAASQDPEVTASDGSAVTFNAASSTTSGGNWLSASPASGSTPSSEAVSVSLNGLAAGTYHGTVTFTSSGVSNSPISLPVTLTVTASTPPSTHPLEFHLVVVDHQSGGSDFLLLDGSGSVDRRGEVSGRGLFTRFRFASSGGGGSATIVSSGTWKPTSFTSFTPVSGSHSGGVLVLQVRISPQGGSSSTGTMTISSTGTNSGVTLSINGGATFDSAGISTVSIKTTSDREHDSDADDERPEDHR